MKEVDTMTNTSNRKPTLRDNFNEIREILVNGNYPDHLIEFVDGRLAQLDKKNSAERKPTAKQTENAGFKSDILAAIEPDTLYTAADITKVVPSIAAAGLTVQRVSAMLSQMVTAGTLVRTEDKRKNFYSLA